ncbi:MAG: DUF4230 domain-containing protein [Moraxella sp.]|uniref:DUF4230 domain-containing protein n=1 Tax=Moraxella sp. TaxID=479 RepID=UPI0026DB87B7|nr:DUF4230 domain-containing protein [Moraxella sp.]MDO4449777.1 DUF4230 domain-containing protein [Moraxella sp.]
MTAQKPSKRKYSKLTLIAITIFMAMTVILTAIFTVKLTEKPAISAISRDGVVTDIQKMAKLTTVSFNVDTIITSNKEGTWYKLWQDEQKGLFIAKGRVLAGVDLSKLTADDVDIRYAKELNAPVEVRIKLPKSEIFEVFLDDIQVYDWQTGLFGMVAGDPEILNKAQESGKIEVLKKACQGDIMTLAKDSAIEQIKHLFALTEAKVSVEMAVGECQ